MQGTSRRPRIVITAGDPAGIGPEIILKALADPRVRRACRPIVVGDPRFFHGVSRRQPIEFEAVHSTGAGRIRPGRVSAAGGRAAYDCIVRAAAMITEGTAEALVTAPLSKDALQKAGVRYPGHTELLGALTHSSEFAMLMVAGGLRTVMVTRHLPISRVPGSLSVREIVRTTRIGSAFLRQRCGCPDPAIAVCALNPHAGERGMLGREELEIIGPAVRRLSASGLRVSGPFPVDSAWMKLARGGFDLLVAMYHDQAMTGLKCLAPERIVNVTAGLPFVRTSPGHGTAFDIAGRGLADPRPMIEAVLAAAGLSKGAAPGGCFEPGSGRKPE